jgi:hypothetical protein
LNIDSITLASCPDLTENIDTRNRTGKIHNTLVNACVLNDKERMATFELKRRIKVNPNRRSKIEPAEKVLLAILHWRLILYCSTSTRPATTVDRTLTQADHLTPAEIEFISIELATLNKRHAQLSGKAHTRRAEYDDETKRWDSDWLRETAEIGRRLQ